MYWKKNSIIEENILLSILNTNSNNIPGDNILKKYQSITSCNYCNYIHKHGKNKGLICGTISKSKNGKCYTHSRNKANCNNKLKMIEKKSIEIKKKELKIIVERNNIKVFNLYFIQKHILFYNINSIKNNNLFKIKTLFIFQKHIYDIIMQILFDVKNNITNTILTIPDVEKNQQSTILRIKDEDTSTTSKKHNSKKNKKKTKKIINVKNKINLNVLKTNINLTLTFFDEKVDKEELRYTLHLLLKENIKLFKVYVNIILSNMNIFFDNVNMDLIFKIWKDNLEFIPYSRVLIFNDNSYKDIIEKVFGYVKGNYNIILESEKILWVDFYKNSIVPYTKKYNIDCCKSGINIYDNKDVKKENILPLHKLTILYY